MVLIEGRYIHIITVQYLQDGKVCIDMFVFSLGQVNLPYLKHLSCILV